MIVENLYPELKKHKFDFAETLGTVVVGAYYGYCKANDIPIENAEFFLKYGPMIFQASRRALPNLFRNLIKVENEIRKYPTSTTIGNIRNTGAQAISNVAVYGTKGALETLLGFGIGYGIGSLQKMWG